MKRQLVVIVAAGTLLCASTAWSQSNSSTQSIFTDSTPGAWTAQSGSTDTSQSSSGSDSQSGVVGPQDTFTHPEALPALSLFSDAVSHTGISLSTTVGTSIQQVGTSGYNTQWQNQSQFGGGVSIIQTRPTYGWAISYNGGVNVTNASGYNYSLLNQSAAGRVTWNISKRWQLRVRDNYFYSDDPFQPFLTFIGTPAPNDPNPVVYYPQAIVEQNQAHIDLTYELGAHDSMNFSAGESFQKYLRSFVSALWNSTNYSEAAFYQHEFSGRLAAGGGYQFAALDFGHGQSRAGVQTFEGFVSYDLNSRMQASAWIGPQVTSNKSVVPIFCSPYGCFVEVQHTTSLNIAEGGTFKWKMGHSDILGVEFSHGVSDGGGVIGVANIYTLTGTYSRPLNHTWTLGAGASYNNSDSVSHLRADQYLKSTAGTVGVARNLFNNAWNMYAYYAFIHQTQNYAGLPAVVTTSGFGFTLRYVWNYGLGR